jgi:hypothetical protein
LSKNERIKLRKRGIAFGQQAAKCSLAQRGRTAIAKGSGGNQKVSPNWMLFFLQIRRSELFG